jgi:hypothetical protein
LFPDHSFSPDPGLFCSPDHNFFISPDPILALSPVPNFFNSPEPILLPDNGGLVLSCLTT